MKFTKGINAEDATKYVSNCLVCKAKTNGLTICNDCKAKGMRQSKLLIVGAIGLALLLPVGVQAIFGISYFEASCVLLLGEYVGLRVWYAKR